MSAIVEKWGKLVAERGFTNIPVYLLNLNLFLPTRISPIGMLVLFQLVECWWDKDEMPRPSLAAIAGRCGVSSRQVSRTLNELEAVGLVKRNKRTHHHLIRANGYDLSPLVASLDTIAKVVPHPLKTITRAQRKVIQETLNTIFRDS
jgi:predicted transcriptional regulator